MKERYYVVAWLAIDMIYECKIYDGPLETADDIEIARLTFGPDAILINWKQIQ